MDIIGQAFVYEGACRARQALSNMLLGPILATAVSADMTERVQFNKFDNNWVKSLWALFFIEYQYILWQKLGIGCAWYEFM